MKKRVMVLSGVNERALDKSYLRGEALELVRVPAKTTAEIRAFASIYFPDAILVSEKLVWDIDPGDAQFREVAI